MEISLLSNINFPNLLKIFKEYLSKDIGYGLKISFNPSLLGVNAFGIGIGL
mgnify:CR=1 FL=1